MVTCGWVVNAAPDAAPAAGVVTASCVVVGSVVVFFFATHTSFPPVFLHTSVVTLRTFLLRTFLILVNAPTLLHDCPVPAALSETTGSVIEITSASARMRRENDVEAFISCPYFRPMCSHLLPYGWLI